MVTRKANRLSKPELAAMLDGMYTKWEITYHTSKSGTPAPEYFELKTRHRIARINVAGWHNDCVLENVARYIQKSDCDLVVEEESI